MEIQGITFEDALRVAYKNEDDGFGSGRIFVYLPKRPPYMPSLGELPYVSKVRHLGDRYFLIYTINIYATDPKDLRRQVKNLTKDLGWFIERRKAVWKSVKDFGLEDMVRDAVERKEFDDVNDFVIKKTHKAFRDYSLN